MNEEGDYTFSPGEVVKLEENIGEKEYSLSP